MQRHEKKSFIFGLVHAGHVYAFDNIKTNKNKSRTSFIPIDLMDILALICTKCLHIFAFVIIVGHFTSLFFFC